MFLIWAPSTLVRFAQGVNSNSSFIKGAESGAVSDQGERLMLLRLLKSCCVNQTLVRIYPEYLVLQGNSKFFSFKQFFSASMAFDWSDLSRLSMKMPIINLGHSCFIDRFIVLVVLDFQIDNECLEMYTLKDKKIFWYQTGRRRRGGLDSEELREPMSCRVWEDLVQRLILRFRFSGLCGVRAPVESNHV